MLAVVTEAKRKLLRQNKPICYRPVHLTNIIVLKPSHTQTDLLFKKNELCHVASYVGILILYGLDGD